MKLRIEKGAEAGRVFDLDSELITIGRAADNDIVVSDAMVSQHHAKIWRDLDGKISVTDMDSVNGTEVNGRLVQTAELRPGDRLLLGKTVVRILDDDTATVTAQPAGRWRSEAAASEDSMRAEDHKQRREPPAPLQGASATAESTIDLGFEERKPSQGFRAEAAAAKRAAGLPSLLTKRVKWTLIGAVGVVLLALAAKWISDKLSGPTYVVREKAQTAAIPPTEIYYETVMGSVADPENPRLRRFEIRLKDGKLQASLDAPKRGQGQRLRREKQLTDEQIKRLVEGMRLAQLSKVEPREKITQLNKQTYFYCELRVTQGLEYMEFIVRNTDLADELRTAVKALEDQASHYLGIRNEEPEDRLRTATSSFEEAQRYLQNDTQLANLYRAWKRFNAIVEDLSDLEPKPPVYQESKKLALTTRQTLEERAERNIAAARVSIQMREWAQADQPLRENMEMVDRDENDPIYKRAFEIWQREVLPRLPRK
jgi:pSer/pThr/pTyr-binding forkhead associated (FHA) protein